MEVPKCRFIFVATNVVSTPVSIEKDIQQKRFNSGYEKALVNLLYTTNWLRDIQQTTLKPHGIKEQHYNVLRILKGRYPKTASAGEIKAVMLDKSPDLTRLVDKLCSKGWVERETCPENRRKVNLIISDLGIEILKDLNKVIKKSQVDLFINISESEANELSDMLDRLRGSQ